VLFTRIFSQNRFSFKRFSGEIRLIELTYWLYFGILIFQIGRQGRQKIRIQMLYTCLGFLVAFVWGNSTVSLILISLINAQTPLLEYRRLLFRT